MKTLANFLVSLAVSIAPAVAGTWMISNSKGFSSNPIVDVSGVPLTGLDPVMVAVGTFASQPGPIAGSGATLGAGQYAALLAEFTAFGPQVLLVTPTSPLNLRGVFDFQYDGAVLGTPLAGKPVYLIIAKGPTLANATQVAILRTDATFDSAEDENALPKRVGVGVTLGTTVIVGSELLHTASATNLDPTVDRAYSLAALGGSPDIVVEQPLGSELTNHVSMLNFGSSVVGVPGDSFGLRIRNFGDANLTVSAAALAGGDAASFSLDAGGLPGGLAPGQETGLAVRFTPQHSGPHSAMVVITSNDPDENPFEIALTGQGLSPNYDTDGDGLNDAAEFSLKALGFDWRVSQPVLVDTLMANANLAGLYTRPQVQALNMGVPLLARDPATGKFKLTLGLRKSGDLLHFEPFPFTSSGTSINPLGQMEFEFTTPDHAAFFRLEAR